MPFSSLSEEQSLIQETAKRYAIDTLAPHSGEWDRTKHFPVDIIRASADLGFAGIYVDEKNGGAGLSRFDAALIFEQLAYVDVSKS